MTSAINVTAINDTVPAQDAELFSQPIRDNFAGIKTVFTVTKSEIETLQSTVTAAQAAADTAALNNAKSYADSIVVGLLDDRGSYNASANSFPTSGGSGAAGAILKGDMWFISVAGTLGSVFCQVGTSIRALVDTPAQTAANWGIVQTTLGFTPENSSNKDLSGGYVGKTLEKINIWNTARTFLSFFVSATTAARTWTLPDASGTFALAEDTHNSSAKTTPVDADELGLFDSETGYILKKISFLNLKLIVTNWNNPIGTIREFNVSTNPATLLGFGTWTAHGTGRTTVAIDAGQTEFATLGQTGGAKTHTLTTSEMPSHSHNDNTQNVRYTGTGGQFVLSGGAAFNTGGAATSSVGSGSPHNNLQPYIVTYRWVRTA
jgi:hypothetical protein